MGLQTTVRKTYLNIMFGKVVQKVKSDTPGAVSRTNKNGETVYEINHDKLTGKISSIKVEEHDQFGKQIRIVVDDDQQYLLTISMRGGYGTGFLFRMMNVDFSKEVTFVPYLIPQEDSKPDKAVLVLYQDDKKVESFFTKENKNGLPELEPITVKGKKTWDDTKRIIFLERVIEEKIQPKIEAAKSSFISDGNELEERPALNPKFDDLTANNPVEPKPIKSVYPEPQNTPAAGLGTEEEDDDLPF